MLEKNPILIPSTSQGYSRRALQNLVPSKSHLQPPLLFYLVFTEADF
jgi:hypothetical protein